MSKFEVRKNGFALFARPLVNETLLNIMQPRKLCFGPLGYYIKAGAWLGRVPQMPCTLEILKSNMKNSFLALDREGMGAATNRKQSLMARVRQLKKICHCCKITDPLLDLTHLCIYNIFILFSFFYIGGERIMRTRALFRNLNPWVPLIKGFKISRVPSNC